MDLSTTYMGVKLRNPIIVSSNKLTGNIEEIKKCADKGAGAIVLKSLFEEQLTTDPSKLETDDNKYYWFPEAVDYINDHAKGKGVKEYLDLIKAAKEETSIPVFCSINCVTDKVWPEFAKQLEEAGADGLELNIAIMPFTAEMDCRDIEERYVNIVKEVRKHVSFPIAVKLGSYFTNPVLIAKRLKEAGADGIVAFNRFFRPDIDVESESLIGDNFFSAPEENTVPLRWVSILKNNLDIQVAAATGIHCAEGVIKQLLAGADAVQICTTLYKHGISYIETMLERMEDWMERKSYNKIDDFKGKMLEDQKNFATFQRVQFMKRTIS
ncbi:MAG: dihydroorotate dehydrogenase-like protein [Bacteroidales bacterium]|nr:dihydroorotate dehydrogenase-like protein [Bacteroidales bacterium]MCF8388305.1 dihydroorotate dehydrogenase-like protein [Bacteroidales bacterium]MCF8398939.1 dihydroorotate dehydrogenase-like protein [Bacteroidales bacterium]